MKIFDRLLTLRTFFAGRREAADMARRWRKAAELNPKLREDLLILGRVAEIVPMARGETPDPIDPEMILYEKGRRDLALQLLALMNVTYTDLNTLLMETDDA